MNIQPLFENDVLITEMPKTALKSQEFRSPEEDDNLSFQQASAAARVVSVLLATIGGHVEWIAAYSKHGNRYAVDGIAERAFGNIPVHYIAAISIQGNREIVLLGQTFHRIADGQTSATSAIEGILVGMAGNDSEGKPRVANRDWILSLNPVEEAYIRFALNTQEQLKSFA